jgi:hypothetical protein
MELPVKKLWEDISLSQWKDILTQIGAGNSWSIKGRALKGCCPFPGHVDARPSCWIVPDKGFVKCFGCGKYQSNALLFISSVGKLSWSGSARLLRSRGVKTFPKTVEKKLAEEEKKHLTKEELAYACNRTLVLASDNRGEQKYLFAQKCIKYLEKRGVPASAFPNLPIGVLPPTVVINEHVQQTNSVYEYVKPVLEARNIGSLVFFYHQSPSEISRFKIRSEFMRGDSPLSKEEQFIPDTHEDGIGFFGLANFMGSLGKPATGGLPAVLVEGEFDALAHLVNYLQGITYDVVLGVGGAGASSPDLLQKTCGISKLLLVADHPDHGGDTIAKSLMKSTSLSCRIFEWPDEVSAKDPHAAIELYGWDTWVACLNKLTPTKKSITERAHFTPAYKWLIEQTRSELATIDVEDIAELKRIVASNGSCLRDPDSQRLYCIECAKFVPLSLSSLLEIVVGQDDSEEGFISRITQALAEEVSFVGIEGVNSTECTVRGWSRKTKTPLAWRISRPAELLGKLESELGPAADWLKGNVGIPRSLAFRVVGKRTVPLSLIDLNVKMEKYLRYAMGRVVRGLPSISSLEELKAGAHYITLSFGGGQEEKCWAIVNGLDVYIGRFMGGILEWSMLDGPKIGKYTFNIVKAKWSRIITGCESLQEGETVDIEETYDFLVSAIHNSWKLKGGLPDAEYIAAAMMLTPISGCLPHPLYTMINGQRGSGKSKLLDLVGGKDPDYRLLESTIDIPASYTSAGTRKDVNRCGLGLVLDEFEDKGDDKQSRIVREILIDLRALTSSPQSKITRGNAESKEVTEYIIKSMIWCCGIQYLRDEADISRFMQFESVRVEDHPHPHLNLASVFGLNTLRHFKRNISVGLFSRTRILEGHISELRTYYNRVDVKDDLAAHAGMAVPSRLLDSIVITASLVQLVGRDPHSYIRRIVKTNLGLIGRITSSTHTKDLLDQVLSARVEHKRPGADSRTTAIRTILADKTERHRLLDLDCGLSYTEYTDTDSSGTRTTVMILVVMWPDVLSNILSRVPRFAKEKAGRLKRMGDSSDIALKYHTVRKKVPRMKSLLRPGITSNDITLYNISSILDAWDGEE